MNNDIGDRIKRLRGTESQDAFSKRFSMSKQTVLRYEAGKTAPDAVFIKKLCESYGVSSDWLIFGDDRGSAPAAPSLNPRPERAVPPPAPESQADNDLKDELLAAYRKIIELSNTATAPVKNMVDGIKNSAAPIVEMGKSVQRNAKQLTEPITRVQHTVAEYKETVDKCKLIASEPLSPAPVDDTELPQDLVAAYEKIIEKQDVIDRLTAENAELKKLKDKIERDTVAKFERREIADFMKKFKGLKQDALLNLADAMGPVKLDNDDDDDVFKIGDDENV